MRLLPFKVHYGNSAHGIQLPSTVDNFRQHLFHHDTSFIAFSMNELSMNLVTIAMGGLVSSSGVNSHFVIVRAFGEGL